MSAADSLAVLLADLDEPESPRPEFAEVLFTRLGRELGLAPARAQRRLRLTGLTPAPPRRKRLALALALLLLLAVVASATYLVAQLLVGAGATTPRPPQPPAAADEGSLPSGAIAFTGGGQVYIWQHGRTRRLTTGPRWSRAVAWSPDGSRLLVSRSASPSGAGGLYIYRVNGSVQSRIRGSSDDWGAWSPDGKRIAFFRYRTHDLLIDPGNGPPRRLLLTRYHSIGGPSWSPDGRRLVFWGFVGGRGGLWILDTASPVLQPRRLARGSFTEPTWSPDGSTIAYARMGPGATVVLIRPDGTRRRELPTECFAPAWSPDGSRIACATYTAQSTRTNVFRKDGKLLRTLPGCPCADLAPGFTLQLTWSPDGRTIAYSGGSGMRWNSGRGIYVVRLDRPTPVRLAYSRSVQFDHPLWQPRRP